MNFRSSLWIETCEIDFLKVDEVEDHLALPLESY